MELNADLIRELLIYIKENASDVEPIRTAYLDLPPYSQSDVLFHIELLADKNYIVRKKDLFNSKSWWIERLTFDGYEFLNLIQSDTVWKKIKDYVGTHGWEALPTIIQIAAPAIKQLFGTP